jgi:DNA polymerase-3 subunit delta'
MPLSLEPQLRTRVVGREALERGLRAQIVAGTLSNGWLICGPNGSGKATLAYRLARALLDPAALTRDGTLDMPADARTARLVAQKAHPDLFVAERRYDDKRGAHETEIAVDTIRELGAFLSKTAGEGGWRAAIVDAADHLNRSAANALLKSLEEPPQRTAILLVAHRPGRLLATIRSRCRRIALPPLPDALIVSLLTEEAGLASAEAAAIAEIAQGRPGYALSLAGEDGAEAAQLADRFIALALAGRDTAAIGYSLSAKAAAAKWPLFLILLQEKIARAASRAGRRQEDAGALRGMQASALVDAHDRIASLAGRGDALNLDRGQLLSAMGRELRRAAL